MGHDHFDRGGASAEGAAEENFGNCSDRLDREFPETNGTTRVFAWPFGGNSPGNGAFKVAERKYLASRTIHCSSIQWDHSMDPSTRTALPGCELSRSNMAGCASLPLSHDDEHAALSVVERAHRDRAWVIGFGHGVQSCAYENWTDTYVPGRGEVLSEAIRHDVTGETVECRHGWNPLPKHLVEGHARHIAEMRDTRDVWVATLGTVVRYMMASRVLEPRVKPAWCDPTKATLKVFATLRTGERMPPEPVSVAVEFPCGVLCGSAALRATSEPCGGGHQVLEVEASHRPGGLIVVRGLRHGAEHAVHVGPAFNEK